MFSKDLAQLSPSTTLAELPTYSHRVEADALGQEIQNEFQDRPELPGVIISKGGEVAGVISRRKFLEQMSQPYSLELYLRRPVSMLLDIIESDALRLPSTCRIDKAVRQALNRPLDLLYEPIVVRDVEDNRLGLLELNILLLAQSQIFAQLSNRLKKEKEQARQYALGLQREQTRVQEYSAKLQTEQLEVQRRNQVLELQRAKLANQTQEITEYNERFVRIGRLLSSEGKRTFEEMLHSVEAIGECTERINEIGKAFSTELEAVNGATQLIERVSQQVRHLSIQAALIANRAQDEAGAGGNQLSGFSNITSEIGSLGSKTFEATNQVNQIASRFKFQIQELLDAARESDTVARALLARSEQTREALQELERLSAERRHSEPSEDTDAAGSEPDGTGIDGAAIG